MSSKDSGEYDAGYNAGLSGGKRWTDMHHDDWNKGNDAGAREKERRDYARREELDHRKWEEDMAEKARAASSGSPDSSSYDSSYSSSYSSSVGTSASGGSDGCFGILGVIIVFVLVAVAALSGIESIVSGGRTTGIDASIDESQSETETTHQQSVGLKTQPKSVDQMQWWTDFYSKKQQELPQKSNSKSAVSNQRKTIPVSPELSRKAEQVGRDKYGRSPFERFGQPTKTPPKVVRGQGHRNTIPVSKELSEKAERAGRDKYGRSPFER